MNGRDIKKKQFKKIRNKYRKICKDHIRIWMSGDWRFMMSEGQEEAYDNYIANLTAFAGIFNISVREAADVLWL